MSGIFVSGNRLFADGALVSIGIQQLGQIAIGVAWLELEDPGAVRLAVKRLGRIASAVLTLITSPATGE